MKNLFTLTLCTVLFAGLYLAGCDTTTITQSDLAISEQVGESLTAAKAAQIDICHKRNDKPYILISITEDAVDAHRQHGDGLVADRVPGMFPLRFDDACVPIDPPSPKLCPCWTEDAYAEITSTWIYTPRRDLTSEGELIRNPPLTGPIPHTFRALRLFITGRPSFQCTHCEAGGPCALRSTDAGEYEGCSQGLVNRAVELGLPCDGTGC